jgi:hypothetical protein
MHHLEAVNNEIIGYFKQIWEMPKANNVNVTVPEANTMELS